MSVNGEATVADERIQTRGVRSLASELPSALLGAEDLTERARQHPATGPLPFDGEPMYEAVFDDLARALHRKSPRHVLLVRERGVGDQAVLAELARRGVVGRPSFLTQLHFLSVDCRYIPADHSRQHLLHLLSAAAARPEVVLCIDGLAPLLRGRGGRENREVLLSALSHVGCRVLGLVTPHEYEELFAEDPDAMEVFSVVWLTEPDVKVAKKLLRHLAGGLSRQYGLEIEDAAVERAVTLSHNYMMSQRLPQKALKLLHEACEDLDYDRGQRGGEAATVTEAAVVAKIAQITGIPETTLQGIGDDTDYAAALSEVIVGQGHVLQEIGDELGMIRAGLADPGKPASVMLFVGQTGTGKTETAKAIARLYSTSKRLKTFTLGNFSEPHSVSGIIGVPAGYVGHDQGGRLINELNSDPYGVFLLDEADKSHPDVMQPFLNLFDEGWIYDQRGVKAYADRAIFILTTNVGQRQIADMHKNGKSFEEIIAKMKESLSQIRHTKSNRPVFTPEFLARIRRIIVFKPLDEEAMTGICERLVEQMKRQWREQRRKELQVDEAIIGMIGRRAHAINEEAHGKEGGRIVHKLLADVVGNALQAAIAADPDGYRGSGVIRVDKLEGHEPDTPSTAQLRDVIRVQLA